MLVPAFEATVVVVTEPLALAETPLAEVKLPIESTEYCAVPVPPPQATNKTETLAAVVNENARNTLLLNGLMNFKISLPLIGIDLVQDLFQLPVSEH